MFQSGLECQRALELERTVNLNLSYLHAVRTSVATSTDTTLEDSVPYSSTHSTYSRQELYRWPLVSLRKEVPSELLTADRHIRNSADIEMMKEKDRGRERMRERILEGGRLSGHDLRGSSGPSLSPGQGPSSCGCWVPLSIVPLLCLHPTQVFQSISCYGSDQSYDNPEQLMWEAEGGGKGERNGVGVGESKGRLSVESVRESNSRQVHGLESSNPSPIITQILGKTGKVRRGEEKERRSDDSDFFIGLFHLLANLNYFISSIFLLFLIFLLI